MRLPLKAKAILMILVVSLLIGVAGIVVYYRGIKDLTTKEYESRSLDIVAAMAEIVDADQVRRLRDAILTIYDAQDEIVLSDEWGTPEFDDYIAKYAEIEDTEEFQSLREQLREVQDVIDVDCLYINWLDLKEQRYVYLVDGAYEDACPPGCADPLFLAEGMEVDNLEEGCPPNVTHTREYGWLVTTGMPIHTDDGEIVGYAAVDISMNDIVDHENDLLLKSVLVFGVATVIASLIGIIAVDRTIIRPINKLSETAATYTGSDFKFSDLDIKTGDEIEVLADSMKRMEHDVKDYYENLMATKSDLETAKEYAAEYKREASSDALTELANKRAYDATVEELEKNGTPFAIVMIDLNDLKVINDRYGHEKGDIAIKNLAALICDVFDHSPVFRIGGDEFVVVLCDGDLEARESLIGQFRDEIRKSSANLRLEPWEKISAACGYAVYDEKTDDGAASVFKRADEDMYEHKVRMKKDFSSVR